MDENSTQIIKRYFREYYFRYGSKIPEPSEIGSREFGYLPFGGMMVRHLSFKDMGSFRALLMKDAPAGVYCSNSRYEYPNAEMHLKGWKKTDLIFDIDADALKQPCKKVHDMWLCKGCGKKDFGLRPEACPFCKNNRILELSWTCSLCVGAAKKETMRLLEFLEFDFGISPAEINVYFSGNAGYHVSIEKSRFELLDTHGRAEIADYLSGRGLSPEIFNSQRLQPNDPGWRGRVARYIRDLPEDDQTFSKSGGVYERRLGELANHFSKKQVDAFFNRMVIENSVRIDAMVTTDVHRIFRVPETLNNKTGLVKRQCDKDLDKFDPLSEAIAIKDDNKTAEVMVEKCPRIELGGKSYGPLESETIEIPIYVAVYLVSKGAAKFSAPVGEKSKEIIRSVSSRMENG